MCRFSEAYTVKTIAFAHVLVSLLLLIVFVRVHNMTYSTSFVIMANKCATRVVSKAASQCFYRHNLKVNLLFIHMGRCAFHTRTRSRQTWTNLWISVMIIAACHIHAHIYVTYMRTYMLTWSQSRSRHIHVTYMRTYLSHTCYIHVTYVRTYLSHTCHILVTYMSHTCRIHALYVCTYILYTCIHTFPAHARIHALYAHAYMLYTVASTLSLTTMCCAYMQYAYDYACQRLLACRPFGSK